MKSPTFALRFLIEPLLVRVLDLWASCAPSVQWSTLLPPFESHRCFEMSCVQKNIDMTMLSKLVLTWGLVCTWAFSHFSSFWRVSFLRDSIGRFHPLPVTDVAAQPGVVGICCPHVQFCSKKPLNPWIITTYDLLSSSSDIVVNMKVVILLENKYQNITT